MFDTHTWSSPVDSKTYRVIVKQRRVVGVATEGKNQDARTEAEMPTKQQVTSYLNSCVNNNHRVNLFKLQWPVKDQKLTNLGLLTHVHHHMTSNDKFLTRYQSFIIPKDVHIANGKTIKVYGQGNVKLNNQLTLYNELYVYDLNYNLLSVRRLLHDNKCNALFSSSKCVFQEKSMKRMIGNANYLGGLYLLEVEPDNCKAMHTQLGVSSRRHSNSTDVILLWHKRLGHPNFVYLKHVMPHLFEKTNIKQ